MKSSLNHEGRKVWGGGAVGFGCGAILGAFVTLVLLFALYPSNISGWSAAGIGIVLVLLFGFLGARRGDPFFEWVLRKALWIWPFS